MKKNKDKLNILLYGDIFSRSYRSHLLIKFLLESKHHISLIAPEFYLLQKKQHLVSKFFLHLHLIELFAKAIFSDVIYLLPTSNKLIQNAIWAAKLFNKKLVVEMYVSLYDTCVTDRNLIKEGSRKAKTLIKKDILALTQSDYVINTTVHELTCWEKNLDIKVDRTKVFIAPICNVSTLVLKRSFMQNSVLKICWWGTFVPLHGLDNVLQAMRILKEQKVKFTCNLFGVNGTSFSDYAEKIQAAQLDTHVFLRKDLNFANNSLPNYLIDNCDLAMGIFGNTDKARNVVPNKLIEALSMAIPTLTMNSPALKEFFNTDTDIWTCEPLPESIAESILSIAGGTAYPVNWEQTRHKVLNTFSATQYQEVVSKILGRVLDSHSFHDSLSKT